MTAMPQWWPTWEPLAALSGLFGLGCFSTRHWDSKSYHCNADLTLTHSDLSVSRWLLAAISSLSPFGVSIMVPLIPILGQSMHHSARELQYLFSVYVLGLAVSQPIFGIVADRYGRRPVLLAGFTIFVSASAALVLANTLSDMIILRFVQAIGVGVGTVVSRSIIRDYLPPEEALKAFGLLTAAMGFTPVIAPIIGGIMAPLFGLESVFMLLTLLGSALLILCYRHIPSDAGAVSNGASLTGYLSLLRSASFWGHTGAFGFLQGMVFALLSTGSLLFTEQFGLSMTAFSFVWGASALIYVGGSFLLSHTSAMGTHESQRRAVIALATISISTILLVSWQGLSLLTVVIPFFSAMLLSGILTPGTMFGAVNAVPQLSGSAAGLSSSIGMAMAGVFSWLGAASYEANPAWIILCFAGAGIGFTLCWHGAHRGNSAC